MYAAAAHKMGDVCGIHRVLTGFASLRPRFACLAYGHPFARLRFEPKAKNVEVKNKSKPQKPYFCGDFIKKHQNQDGKSPNYRSRRSRQRRSAQMRYE